jgi:hypothetical protein
MSKIDASGALSNAPGFTVASALGRSWTFFWKNPLQLTGQGFLSLIISLIPSFRLEDGGSLFLQRVFCASRYFCRGGDYVRMRAVYWKYAKHVRRVDRIFHDGVRLLLF